MKRKIHGLFLLILFPFLLGAQTKLVEKVSRKGSELVIPYEKYKLPNGLTLIVHEDHSDPVIYVDVTYHVGSAREEIGKSGFAHFFEHMSFNDSENTYANADMPAVCITVNKLHPNKNAKNLL